MKKNKNVECKKCSNKFHQKEIYTIQQFQYKKEPDYKWILNFLKKFNLDEWDSFCEKCIKDYSEKVDNAWNNEKSQVL
ncbi:MAG TPA: hypothetical protein QF656_05100 [Nitrosopumilus sp.]|jgi:hypothetical protein|nr:hypothetical protein [Nitrosopumilus sp.]